MSIHTKESTTWSQNLDSFSLYTGKKSDEDNHKTFTRTIQHLEATHYLPMILKRNDDGNIERWLDACFVVHDAMQNRTSMNVSIGRGSVYAVSAKQKLNYVLRLCSTNRNVFLGQCGYI